LPGSGILGMSLDILGFSFVKWWPKLSPCLPPTFVLRSR
jgi:hypothetical protein